MAGIEKVQTPDDLGEADRAIVRANGIVVDIIADDDDDMVYVEFYAYAGSSVNKVMVTVTEAEDFGNLNANAVLRLEDR